MTAILLERIVILFCGLFVLGVIITLPLYKFDYYKFIHSNLFIKILFWIPIFGVFLSMLYASNGLRSDLLVLLLVAAGIEFVRVVRHAQSKLPLTLYFMFFAFGLSHFYLIGSHYQADFVSLLITICFATVLSDVLAFFFGNYVGHHKLPTWLNPGKSWEGVSGQVVGALLGVLLVNWLLVPVQPLWLFLPLGVGSALGDLANSYVKRQADIKDWSQAIPGHGGFLDRLSSMAGSTALLFYALTLTH